MSRINNLTELNLIKNQTSEKYFPRGITTSEKLDFSIYDPLVKNLRTTISELDFILFNIRNKILGHMKLKII